MKKLILTLITICAVSVLFAQDSGQVTELPAVNIFDIDQSPFNTGEIQNDGKPIIVSFWATWCTPCVKELNTIMESYEDWQDETGVKLVAISIDDARNAARVKPFVNGRSWEYEVYLDKNSDFKRAMNVVNVPHTFLIDGEGNIVYSHNSYAPGDEEELYDKILELVEGDD
jgi:thiol-disulfide isomerase/thioredoxin